MAFSRTNAKPVFAAAPRIAPSTAPLYARLEALLASSGDSRIALAKGSNKYGCTPFPQPDKPTYSSSTASSISERAYLRASRSRMRLVADAAVQGVGAAFDAAMAASRAALKQLLRLPAETGLVFAASGTDAQLSALFLTRSLLAGPMTVIIVGSDQTGSGTVHTARGRHFDDRTAQDAPAMRGGPIAELAQNLASVEIGFLDASGRIRTEEELDRMVWAAVQEAIAQDRTVLLQAMDASKMGWHGPSLDCLAGIAARWRGKVQIVIDACQLRCGRSRLAAYLDLGFMVLLTGSKFFTGPAFSGALLTPACRDAALGRITTAPGGLGAYAGKYDWPEAWPLRDEFSEFPNYGLWLRWEAALEEMDAYYEVPADSRSAILARLTQEFSAVLGAASFLTCVAPACDEKRHATIFSFLLRQDACSLSPADCMAVYQALNRDITALLPAEASAAERMLAAQRCLIGQPVRFGADAAILRIAISARQIRQCWSGSALNEAAIAAEVSRLKQTIDKIGMILRHAKTNPGRFDEV